MTAFAETMGSHNYDKRKVMAKGLARKHNAPIIYVKNRKLYTPDYEIENNSLKIIMWTRFYKRDLKWK